MRERVVAVALFTNPSGPRRNKSTNSIGKKIAEATANAATPPLQVAIVNPHVANISARDEIKIPTVPKARAISRTPKQTAMATKTAKTSLRKASANQTSATRDRPTTTEGKNLRPARRLISSLIV
ncbi:unannotated protein [freshwater metagenome]|uniref:Unannotated protein n=1 Tax=freshwater metagenome TaxID=449393 RepID=A0A6J6YEJ3_9ZZZZ